MKTPFSSAMPTRSASPSFAMPASKRCARIVCSISVRFRAMGSGACMPGKIGLRNPCSSVTFVAPPPMSSSKYPAPVPYIASTHVQPCGAEAIEVDQPRELRDIRRPRVEHLDEPSRFRLSDVHRRDVAPDERRQRLLELGDDLRRGAAPPACI